MYHQQESNPEAYPACRLRQSPGAFTLQLLLTSLQQHPGTANTHTLCFTFIPAHPDILHSDSKLDTPGTLAPWHPGTLAPWHPGASDQEPKQCSSIAKSEYDVLEHQADISVDFQVNQSLELSFAALSWSPHLMRHPKHG